MKKHYLFLATLLVVVAVSVAVVSCKKETQGNLMNNKNESVQTFNPREIEDMNSYLKGFKQKMQSATKGDDEALSLEDAAWHLTSLANFEFAKGNTLSDNLRFDTLYSSVKVSADKVFLSDLELAYENINKSISDLYNNLILKNKSLHFVNVNITDCGNIVISLITTFNTGSKNLNDTCYYFQDLWDALVECNNYFDEFPDLPVQSTGTTELKRVINLLGNDFRPLDYYFTPTSSQTFYFNQNYDPNGSPSLWGSRLYANNSSLNYFDLKLDDRICYYLDSYLGLGTNSRPQDEYILSWNVVLVTTYIPNYNLQVQRHELKVTYGEKHPITPTPGDDPIH